MKEGTFVQRMCDERAGLETEELAKQGEKRAYHGHPSSPGAFSCVLTALWMPGFQPQHIGGKEKAALEGAAPPEEVRSSRQAPQTLPRGLPSRAGSSG